MLSDPLTQDPSNFFRRRFRIPYPIFVRIVEVVRLKDWFSDSYKLGKYVTLDQCVFDILLQCLLSQRFLVF